MNTSSRLIFAVNKKNIEMARELINSYGLSYSRAWAHGYNLLCVAVTLGDKEMTKLLLTSGSKVNINKGRSDTPLHIAVRNNDIEIIEMLLDRDANINAINDFNATPLYLAIQCENLVTIKSFLKHKIDVNSTCIAPPRYSLRRNFTSSQEDGYTPLHLAIKQGNQDIVELFLEHGAYVDARSVDGRTSLHVAAGRTNKLFSHTSYAYDDIFSEINTCTSSVNTEICRLLLNKGANVNASTNNNLTPLHIATEVGNEATVELLLYHGANVDAQNENGTTVLYIASKRGYSKIVEHILKHRPDVHDWSNRNSLNAAVHGDGAERRTIIENLLRYGFTINPDDADEMLIAAVRHSHLKIIDHLLTSVSDVNFDIIIQTTGYTLLHLACERASEKVVELLLRKGGNINGYTKDKLTPLHIATERRSEAIVKMLLEHGANIDAPNEKGRTILYIAAENGDLEMVNQILKFFPDVNNESNRNALVRAVVGYNKEHRTIVENLLQYGFIVNPKDKDECIYLLKCAVQKGYCKLVECLLKHDIDVNTLFPSSDSYNSYVPLHESAENMQEEVAKLLIESGAEVNFKDIYGRTPIFYTIRNINLSLTYYVLKGNTYVEDNHHELINAATVKWRKFVELLLEHGADINASDGVYGKTVLHLIHVCENAEILIDRIKFLLSRGADVNAQSETGETPLHVAAEHGRTKCISILLKHNADVNARDRDKITPLHLSVEGGHREASEMLLNNGADVNAEGIRGNTPFHIAAKKGYLGIVQTLLKFGADIDCTNDKGRTGLYNAIRYRHANVISTLLEYGCDINTINVGKLIHKSKNFYVEDSDSFDSNFEDDFDSDSYFDEDDFDSDSYFDEDDYYPSRACSTKRMNAIVNQHVVKMKTANMYVCPEKLLSIDVDNTMYAFEKECELEVENLKKENVSDSIISYYDILTKTMSRLATYAENTSIVQALESEDYKSKFPIYATLLKSRFQRALQKRDLLKRAKELLCILFKDFTQLPHDCTDIILGHFNDKELKKFISTMESEASD